MEDLLPPLPPPSRRHSAAAHPHSPYFACLAAADGIDQFPDTQRFLELLAQLDGPAPANEGEPERADRAAARGLFRGEVGPGSGLASQASL